MVSSENCPACICVIIHAAVLYHVPTACQAGAGPVIKGYSPDLIVHPLLPTSDDPPSTREARVEGISSWLSRVHVLVVGPGLGRDPVTGACVATLLERARALALPIGPIA